MTGSGMWGWAVWSAHAPLALIALTALVLPGASHAQTSGAATDSSLAPVPQVIVASASDSITVVVGHAYAKPGIHRFFLGGNYRTIWDTPIRVPVLDLTGVAGGLTPVRRVGGLQTRALAIRGADGRSYTFRGLTKDVSGLLEADLQGTVVEELLKDQMSAEHPASELVASEITRAAGI